MVYTWHIPCHIPHLYTKPKAPNPKTSIFLCSHFCLDPSGSSHPSRSFSSLFSVPRQPNTPELRIYDHLQLLRPLKIHSAIKELINWGVLGFLGSRHEEAVRVSDAVWDSERSQLRWSPGLGLHGSGSTQRPQSSSFLGIPYRILHMNPHRELLWGLWV